MSYSTRIAIFTRYADGSVEITALSAVNPMGYVETRLSADEADGLASYLADSAKTLGKTQKEVLKGVHDAQKAEAADEEKKADPDAEALAVAGKDVPVPTADEAKAQEDAAKAAQKAEDARAKEAKAAEKSAEKADSKG